MEPITTNSEAQGPGFIVAVILAVLAVSAFLAVMAWRVCKSAERAERDPRYLRRWLLWFGLLYAFGAVYGIAEVIAGREPVQTLIGLPIGGTFAWLYLKAAARVKVPPSK